MGGVTRVWSRDGRDRVVGLTRMREEKGLARGRRRWGQREAPRRPKKSAPQAQTARLHLCEH